MEREKAHHAVSMLCRVLGVSTSGYYDWRSRKPSAHSREDGMLTEQIGRIHQESRLTYGASRIQAELAAQGRRHGRKHVARPMRGVGGVIVAGRRGRPCMSRGPSQPPIASSASSRPIRPIVGWAMADHLRTELVVSALKMALWNRRSSPGLIHHSD